MHVTHYFPELENKSDVSVEDTMGQLEELIY